MKRLLDTNAYSDLLRADAQVVKHVEQSTHLFMSSIVVGELLYGFRRGSRLRANRDLLEDFLSRPYVSLLSVGRDTAERFASIAADLAAVGQPIPQNDMWIAAHAFESGAELLTADRHFSLVPGLAWVDSRS